MYSDGVMSVQYVRKWSRIKKLLTHIHDNNQNALPRASGTKVNTAWLVVLNLANWQATIQCYWFNIYEEVIRANSESLQMHETDL
jgi:hypothetical protein